jgi:hypothetical protein
VARQIPLYVIIVGFIGKNGKRKTGSFPSQLNLSQELQARLKEVLHVSE